MVEGVEGNVTVTVTKQDHIPFQDNFNISDDVESINIDFNQFSLVEVDGDGDGTINPGEIYNINIPLKNFGSSDINGITATLESESDNVDILIDNVSYGSIDTDQTISSDAF